MKRILTLIVVLVLLATSAYATTKTNILDTRSKLGTDLNNTVNVLKSEIKETDGESKSLNQETKKLLDTATELKKNNNEPEVNPTVLTHGKSNIMSCKSNEELYWDGDSWECKTVNAYTDCIPSLSETVKLLDKNNKICIYKGDYTPEIIKPRECDCFFSAGNGVRYEVSPELCIKNSKLGACPISWKCPSGYKDNTNNCIKVVSKCRKYVTAGGSHCYSKGCNGNCNTNMEIKVCPMKKICTHTKYYHDFIVICPTRYHFDSSKGYCVK